MSILGYNTNGTSTDATDGFSLITRVQAPSGGAIQTAVGHVYAGNSTNPLTLSLYADDGASSTDPTGATRLATCSIALQAAVGDRSANISIPALTAATFYWIGIDTPNPCNTKYDATGATGSFRASAWGNPCGAPGGAWNNRQSAWIEYVAASPSITTQPTPQTVFAGSQATFSITASSSGGALHYQWKANGSNVGSDANSYTTPATTLADTLTVITCDVSDDNGTTVSAAVYLVVLPVSSTFLWKG